MTHGYIRLSSEVRVGSRIFLKVVLMDTLVLRRKMGSLAGFCMLLMHGAVFCTGAAAVDDEYSFFTSPGAVDLRIGISNQWTEVLNSRNREYIAAQVQVNQEPSLSVGLRLRGHSSFQPLEGRPSMALKFQDHDTRRAFKGLKKLLLNNGVTDFGCPREAVALTLFRSAGVPAARSRIVRVALNSRLLGPYLALEPMNRDFLKSHFGNDSGNLYEGTLQDVDQALEQDSGLDHSRSDLRRLLAATLESDPSLRWKELQNILDIDRFLKFAALQMLLGQRDGYLYNKNNYRLYWNPDTARFTFMPHGLDSVFVRGGPLVPPTNSLVMKALWEIPEGRRRYFEIMKSLIANVWDVPKMVDLTRMLEKEVEALSGGKRTSLVTQKPSEFLAAQYSGRLQEAMDLLHQKEPLKLVWGGHDSLPLVGWQTFARSGNPDFQCITNREINLLGLRAARVAVAGWKLTAEIPEGEYRFSCRLRGKKSSGSTGSQSPLFMVHIAGDLGGAVLQKWDEWNELSYPIHAPGGGRIVEFLCELQGGTGEVWIDGHELRLVRLK